jgi:hypothetical protein
MSRDNALQPTSAPTHLGADRDIRLTGENEDSEVLCKIHAGLASRFNMRRTIATSIRVSLVCTFRS